MYFGQTRPMVEYNRQIRYLDYMENGIRTRGAGFIKLEREDNLCSISLQVSGLYRKDRFTRPLLLLDGQKEYELCRLQLADGGIKLYLEKLDCDNLNGQGLKYEQLKGVRIPISEGKEILCMLETQQVAKAVVKEVPFIEDRQGESAGLVVESRAEFTPFKEQEFIPLQELAPNFELLETDIMKESVVKENEIIEAVSAIKDDKWEQLWTVYPHRNPFSDDREYLALGPGDFVILSERNYRLVNNSFLLHGYYNYHHLILTRIRERNKTSYYIGVPGNFYEREKKTAVMFGFKSFECAVEPAEEGDFGYYMMPVEL